MTPIAPMPAERSSSCAAASASISGTEEIQEKRFGVVGAPFRQRVVEHAMPGDAGVARQAVAEDVRPGADDLVVDALLVEPFVALAPPARPDAGRTAAP